MESPAQPSLDLLEEYREEYRPDPSEADQAAPSGEPVPLAIPASEDEVEREIRENLRQVSYLAKEYTIDELIRRHENMMEGEERSELYVPSYQREFIWEPWRRSRFIESILIGLPIPQLLLAQQIAPSDEDEGALEIVDGTQRIRTLWSFVKGGMVLTGLERLTLLNGKTFHHLLASRQRKFLRVNMRALELTEVSQDDVTLDLFLRINQGSLGLKGAEVRRGAYQGTLYENIIAIADSEFTKRLIPVKGTKAQRREREELILRFIAYTFDRERFVKPVAPFLEQFVRDYQNEFKTEWQNSYENVLGFVEKYFPNGFRKTPGAQSVPRVRFEAISVGTALALQQQPDLLPGSFDWLESEEFKRLTSSDGSNSAPRLRDRLFYVRDRLLENAH